MKRASFLLPVGVIFLLALGLPLPIYHASYSKFSLQMVFCALALALFGVGLHGSVIRPGEGPALGLHAAQRHFTALMRTWPFRILLVLLALSLLSRLWSGSSEAWHWSVLFLTTNVMWCMIVYTWLRVYGRSETLLGGYLICAVFAAGLGIAIFGIEIQGNPDQWGNPTHRLIHPLGNADFMAGFLITPVLLAITSALHWIIPSNTGGSAPLDILPLRGVAGRLKAAVFAGLAVILLIALWMTDSRGGGLGLTAGLILLVLIQIKKRARHIALICAAAILCIALLTVELVPSIHEWVRAKASSGTNKVRLVLWGDAVRMIAERPLVGWGAGGFTAFHATIKRPEEHLEYYLRSSAIQPHNEFLAYGVEYGLLGMALYIACVLGLIGRALTSMRRARWTFLQKTVLAGFVGLNVQSCFDVGLRFWDLAPFFWLLAGALFAFANDAEPAGDAPLPPAPPVRITPSLAAGLLILSGLVGVAWCVMSVMDLVGQVDLHTADHAQRNGRWALADTSYHAALRKILYFPDRVTARLDLAECQRKEGLVPDAIATLRELKNYAPNERHTNLQLALLYMQAADQLAASQAARNNLLDSALVPLDIYLKTNTDPRGYLSLARVYLRQAPCRFDKAVAALRTYLSLIGAEGKSFPPKGAGTSIFRMNARPADYLELAALWLASGKEGQALQVLQVAAKRFPDDPAIRDVNKRFGVKKANGK